MVSVIAAASRLANNLFFIIFFSFYIPVLRFSVYLQNLRPQVSPLRSEKFCH